MDQAPSPLSLGNFELGDTLSQFQPATRLLNPPRFGRVVGSGGDGGVMAATGLVAVADGGSGGDGGRRCSGAYFHTAQPLFILLITTAPEGFPKGDTAYRNLCYMKSSSTQNFLMCLNATSD